MGVRNRSSLLAAFLLLAAFVEPAAGQVAAPAASYPNRPVRVTVGFSPGGGVDVLARAVSQKLGETLGRPFVVENRAGGGGTAAYAYIAKAPPDGYTLLAISGSYA